MNPVRFEKGKDRVVVTKTPTPRLFYGYIVAASVFIIWLISWGTYVPSFSVFYKPLLAEFGWTRAEAALAYSLSLIVQAVLAIIMGWLTDKLGPRIVVTVFGSFLGLCYLLMSQITSLWQFQLNFALIGGFGLSALNVPVMATVARWFVKKRGLMTGIVQAGMGIGGLIFSPFAGWLIITHGWRYAYVVLGTITITVIIISGLFLRRDPHDIGQFPDGALEEAPERNHHQPHSPAARFSLRGALRTSQFWMVAGLFCCYGLYRSTFSAHITAHVQDVGFSLIDGANVLAILIGSSMISRIGMGRLADMIGNRQAFMISFAIITAILTWGLVAEDLWELYLFGALFGFGYGAQAVLRFTITSDVFGVTSLGLVMGIFNFAESGAATFGSYFAGYIFDLVGNYQPAFGMCIVVSVIGIILAWQLKPLHKKGIK